MQREEEIGAPPIDSTIIAVHEINRCFSVNLGEQPQPQDLRVGVIPLVEPIYREGYIRGEVFWALPGGGNGVDGLCCLARPGRSLGGAYLGFFSAVFAAGFV